MIKLMNGINHSRNNEYIAVITHQNVSNMKLELQLMREILESVELEPPGKSIQRVITSQSDVHIVAEHIRLMIDGDLLTGNASVSQEQGSYFIVHGLTLRGHELLASIRNDTVWRKLLEKSASLGGGLTIAILTDLGQSYLKELFGIR